MWVTVMTDASWCPDTKAGGFGYWVVSDRGRHGGGGELKQLPGCATEAEMMAVVNGLHCALKLAIAQKGDGILIQTDCQWAITVFNLVSLSNLPENAKQFLPILKAFKALKEKHELRIVFRHVKGHSVRKNPRYIANNMCDKRARQGMLTVRARIKLERAFNVH